MSDHLIAAKLKYVKQLWKTLRLQFYLVSVGNFCPIYIIYAYLIYTSSGFQHIIL